MRIHGAAFASLIVLVSACGIVDAPNSKYSDIPGLETLQKPVETGAYGESEFLQTQNVADACVYLKALSKLENRGENFRLYRGIYGDPETGVISAVQVPSENPQILYKLSREANNGSSPLDPPNVEKFIEMAREQQRQGKTSWGKLRLLEILKLVGAQKKLIQVRNQIVMDTVESQIPGAFSGKATKLEGTALYLEAQKMIPELKTLSASEVRSLALLATATPLFTSDSGEGRLQDIGSTLAILSRSSEKSNLQDKLCRFALSQRLTAQMIVLKGVRDAPATTERGLLIAYPEQDEVTYASANLGGNFGRALSAKELEQKLANGETVRGKASKNTAALIASAKTWLRIMGSSANAEIWTSKTALKADLLKLGFAYFALEMPIIAHEELTLLDNNRLRLSDDTLENLVSLGELSLDGIWVAERLRSPSMPVKNLLTEAQLEVITGKNAESVKSKLEKLLTGLLLEIRARSENESGGLDKLSRTQLVSLADFYSRAGRQLDNSLLQKRAAEIRELAR
ncbi:MAG: hypothetical protein ABIR96_06810 [Bdellovibrionota bacterium]